MTIQILFHDEEVERLLSRLDAALSPIALAAFMEGSVGPTMLARIESRFEQEGDDASGKWAPLQESTNQIREQLGYPPAHPINVRGGELHNFVTGSARSAAEPFGASTTIPDSTPTGELYDKLFTAQAGASQVGYRPTPPRPVLAMDANDLTLVLLQLSQYIRSAVGGSVL